MYPTYLLQWFHEGEWHEIGWHGSTPERHRDLVKHGQRLADHDGHPERYRIVRASAYVGNPPVVVHEYGSGVQL